MPLNASQCQLIFSNFVLGLQYSAGSFKGLLAFSFLGRLLQVRAVLLTFKMIYARCFIPSTYLY